MFSVCQVQSQSAEALETMGSKPKFWFHKDQQQFLFKAEARGTGEDWAEVVACHLCRLIGLPHVTYELAEEWDKGHLRWPGVICPNMSPAPVSLVLGNELLLEQDPEYSSQLRRRVCQHTVQAVLNAVSKLALPNAPWSATLPAEVTQAVDVFVGYLMLDAWIANQDRHHENWGALRDAQGILRLAPTFDHGSSLARNLTDHERKERLETRDRQYSVAAFATRAHSALYSSEPSRPLGTLAAFLQFSQAAPAGARAWTERLAGLTRPSIEAILSEVPTYRMSSVCQAFTLELLWCNRQRLLDARLP